MPSQAEIEKHCSHRTTDESSDSVSQIISFDRPDASTPFSSKRDLRETDTPHKKEAGTESENIVQPGDKEELKKFREKATNSSEIQIKINLPLVSAQFKYAYILYFLII